MKFLVIDVAAEHSGALSILNQFISRFKNDINNKYIVYVSNLDLEDSDNVKFVKAPWVKRSRLHRLYFDSSFVKKIIKKHKPDVVFSLQNKAFKVKGVAQHVYFHNALFICEKRFSIAESRNLWVYQNIIGKMTRKSLKYADKIVVQAEWIKNELCSKWKLRKEKIFVERPDINPIYETATPITAIESKTLFYPANFSSYKNHEILIKACAELWEERGTKSFSLVLSGNECNMPTSLKSLIEGKGYPISFTGILTPEQMKATYSRSILVFPSYIETVGLPLLEAKALGCHIIAADCEYAREGVGVYDKVSYFPPFDRKTLVSLIREAVFD